MVGDRSSDLEAARTCGTEFVGCSFGHGKEEEFDGEQTITHLNQLPDLLA
jgi:phosphoglycolate phosphatase-like HAD superfamily hydrolase